MGTRAPPGPCRACGGWCSALVVVLIGAWDRPADQPTREPPRRTGPARTGATAVAADTVGPWSTRRCPRPSSTPSRELGDWRYLLGAIHATFQAGSYPAAAQLVVAIADAAERRVHHPDIDVRYPAGCTWCSPPTPPVGSPRSTPTLARESQPSRGRRWRYRRAPSREQFELAHRHDRRRPRSDRSGQRCSGTGR